MSTRRWSRSAGSPVGRNDRARHLDRAPATLQELSGGRFTLGVDMSWHKEEFDFIGVEFNGRGRRADEVIWLVRALSKGERDFEGEFWSFHDATSQPNPSPQPEIWVAAARNAPSGGRSSWGMRGTPRAAPTLSTSGE